MVLQMGNWSYNPTYRGYNSTHNWYSWGPTFSPILTDLHIFVVHHQHHTCGKENIIIEHWFKNSPPVNQTLTKVHGACKIDLADVISQNFLSMRDGSQPELEVFKKMWILRILHEGMDVDDR